MYELKIFRGAICHDNEKRCKIWTGIDLSVSNWHEKFDKFWPEHSKISKICTVTGCFWPKCIMFQLKKVWRDMCDGTEDWCKIWRKTDLHFLKIFVYRLKNSNFILVKWQNPIESRTSWFILKIARMFPILTSRNRLMNTFIIVFPYRQSIDRNLNILLNG